eukprot:scaffold10945_cov62-Phaeocystis_antarctica.AAC.4
MRPRWPCPSSAGLRPPSPSCASWPAACHRRRRSAKTSHTRCTHLAARTASCQPRVGTWCRCRQKKPLRPQPPSSHGRGALARARIYLPQWQAASRLRRVYFAGSAGWRPPPGARRASCASKPCTRRGRYSPH